MSKEVLKNSEKLLLLISYNYITIKWSVIHSFVLSDTFHYVEKEFYSENEKH